ncbi:hypothetical protein Mapa_014576 [Marchantia paleacea]|nr:hypothetical protein Mapa_014576 [Marchantia paleacea]
MRKKKRKEYKVNLSTVGGSQQQFLCGCPTPVPVPVLVLKVKANGMLVCLKTDTNRLHVTRSIDSGQWGLESSTHLKFTLCSSVDLRSCAPSIDAPIANDIDGSGERTRGPQTMSLVRVQILSARPQLHDGTETTKKRFARTQIRYLANLVGPVGAPHGHPHRLLASTDSSSLLWPLSQCADQNLSANSPGPRCSRA